MTQKNRVGIPKRKEIFMIIKDLKTVLKTLDGQNLKNTVLEEVKEDEKDGKGNVLFKKGAQKSIQKDLTFSSVITNSLLTDQLEICQFCGRAGVNEKIEGDEKARRGWLSQKIYGAKTEVEVDRDDVKLIKERIGLVYPAMIVYQAWALLPPLEKKVVN